MSPSWFDNGNPHAYSLIIRSFDLSRCGSEPAGESPAYSASKPADGSNKAQFLFRLDWSVKLPAGEVRVVELFVNAVVIHHLLDVSLGFIKANL